MTKAEYLAGQTKLDPRYVGCYSANHKPLVPLYSLGGDVFTTKAPECGECGFTVRKDGSCVFCQ